MSRADVVIVGGGHAGAQVAIGLSTGKFSGSVLLITEEADLPYNRPPLSKQYLAGTKQFEQLLFRDREFWLQAGITVVTGQRVVAVEAGARRITTADGTVFEYGVLVWAAGGRARRLGCAGNDLPGVHTVRSRADVDRMLVELPQVRNVVVVGAGYIGLEAASVLTTLDKAVAVLEMQPRVLARVAGETISRFYERQHRARGVDLHTSVLVEDLVEANGRVAGVRLADGRVFPADMVIVGVGIVPAVEPLLEAGALGGNGVEVDSVCRTTLDGVYAIGDCAAHVNPFAQGARVRVESVQNATEQAATVVKSLLGRTPTQPSVPSFWSDQYDLKLQSIGLSMGHDLALVRGDPSTTSSFSVVYLAGGRVMALDCVNAPRDYVRGRKLVLDGATVDAAMLAANGPLADLAELTPGAPGGASAQM